MKHSPEADALNDLCSSLNPTELITSPTRETSESSTLIDVIMISNPGLVVESGTVETHISDHHLVYSTLNLKLPKPTPTYVKTRCYRHYAHRSFLENLAQVPWFENVLIDDASEKVIHFNHYFLEVLNQHASIKTVKIKHRPCPFVDQEMKEHMKNRNQLMKIAKQTRSSEDWEIYRLSRESIKARLRDSEREHAKTELKNCKKTSSMWKVIKNCIPRKEISQPVYSRDLKDMAEEFNNFFTSVGTRVSEESTSLIGKHNLPTPPIPTPGQEIPESEMFRVHSVSSNKIREIVMAFPSDKAPGYDKVPMSIIKDALPCILPIVTDIVNRSLLTSVFPTAWKISEVIPLPKEGDYEVANNNRPVSLLPAVSKICERVALNQLTSYLKNKKRLTEQQSGNKKSHSTETLNVMMSDKILEAMDSKKLDAGCAPGSIQGLRQH